METILPILLAIAVWPVSLLLKPIRERWPTLSLFAAIFGLAVLYLIAPPDRPYYGYLLFALFGVVGMVRSAREKRM